MQDKILKIWIFESRKINLDSTNSYDFKHSGEVFKNFSSPPLIKTRGLLMVGVYIILVIFAVIMFGFFIAAITSEGLSDKGRFLLPILIIVVSLIFLSFGNVKKDENEPISVECQEIKSFALHSETSTSASGAFYLGCGYVTSSGSTELKYYFYKKGQVGYVFCSISASRVELVETDEKPPGIEGIFTDSGDIKLFENYVIYVPTGTIFEEYKVKL